MVIWSACRRDDEDTIGPKDSLGLREPEDPTNTAARQHFIEKLFFYLDPKLTPLGLVRLRYRAILATCLGLNNQVMVVYENVLEFMVDRCLWTMFFKDRLAVADWPWDGKEPPNEGVTKENKSPTQAAWAEMTGQDPHFPCF